MALFTFDCIEDFAKACKGLRNRGEASSWYGNISYNKAIELAIAGDDSYVKLADSFMDKLDVELPETKAFRSKHSPFGSRVNMSEWLANSPTPMRRRVRSSADINPIKIVVSTTCSAAVEGGVMTKRGAAILALLLKLQTVRPVQLYLLTELDGEDVGWHHQLIRIESQPLHVGVAAFGLCHVGFARQLTYTFAREKDGSRGAWPSGYIYGRQNESYTKLLRERLGLVPEDIVIGSAHIGEKLIERPVEWIEDQLRKLANINED